MENKYNLKCEKCGSFLAHVNINLSWVKNQGDALKISEHSLEDFIRIVGLNHWCGFDHLLAVKSKHKMCANPEWCSCEPHCDKTWAKDILKQWRSENE